MEVNKKNLILGAVIGGITLFVLFIVVLLLWPKATEEGKKEQTPVAQVQENNNVNVVQRKIFYDDKGAPLTGTGRQLAEESQITDPYYFFDAVGAAYDSIFDSLKNKKIPQAKDAAARLVFELQRMNDVTQDTLLKQQINFMFIQARTFQEALKTDDAGIINEAWVRLKPINDFRHTLLDEKLKQMEE